jgi:hypothetical protein
MVSWSLSHLADATLSRGLATSFARESEPLATTLAHIAEFHARKLYLPAAYPNMHAYLLGEFHLSEDEAWKRIQAARAAHRFTAIYDMVAQSRLHLTAVVLLAPHLTDENAAELLEAAAHKTKAQIQLLLAERAPRADVPTVLRPVSSPVDTPTVLQGRAPGRRNPVPRARSCCTCTFTGSGTSGPLYGVQRQRVAGTTSPAPASSAALARSVRVAHDARPGHTRQSAPAARAALA